jgi:RHS repeat-associated protein
MSKSFSYRFAINNFFSSSPTVISQHRLLMAFLAFVLPLISEYASAATYYWASSAVGPTGQFSNPSAVWAAYYAYASPSSPSLTLTSTTIVSATQYRFNFSYNNGASKSSMSALRAGNACAAGATLNMTNNLCEYPQKTQGAQNCQGNPINGGSGNKFQKEVDYGQEAAPSLALLRFYNSQANDDSLSIGQPFGWYWRGTYSRAVVANGSLEVVYRPNGKAFNFMYNSTTAKWQTDADVVSTLEPVQAGWRYIDAENNDDVELYDAGGKLLSITARSGYTQTLTYSDGTTGSGGGYVLNANGNATTTALPAGLLIRVTDTFGKILSFGYNTFNRLVKASDPAGGLYVYRYDTSATAANGNLLSVTYPDGQIRTYVYNEPVNTSNANLPNALTGIVDENGNRFATYKYNTQGRAISSEHANGAEKISIAFTADANGNVMSSAVTDALNATRSYNFTNILGVAKNTGVSQPCSSGCGAASAITYDANGNISSKTDFNGNITNYLYDLTRNLETSRTEAYGTAQARTVTTQWHATYRLPTLISEPGKITSFNYDASGNLLSKTITDTAINSSRVWTWTYNALGQVLTADGPRTDVSDVTTYTYYSTTSAGNYTQGDLATVTNALGQVTSITKYNANGQPLSITDPNGIVTALAYDPRRRLTSRIFNGTQTTTYLYDAVGQLTKVTLPDSSYLSYTFDTAHRLTDITDSSGNKIHYTLDAMSNRTKEETFDPTNALKKTRSRVYDALNRLQKDIGGTNPTTQITQYAYDNVGNLKTTTDPLNHTTTNSYDALNRLIQITDPNNGVAQIGYNALDQQTSVTDPRTLVTNYTNDALGSLKQTQSPDTGTTNNLYDAAGNITQKTDARGIITNYSYDALNRLTAITYPTNTSENVTFTYDSIASGNKGKGRLTGYSSSSSATTLFYDSYGNVTQQTDLISPAIYTTSYQYNSANRITQITYPSGRVVIYTRNPLGQITSVQSKDTSAATAVTLISNATYFPFGPLNTLAFGNGVNTTIQLDADYRTSRITASSTPVWDFVYTYDPKGNITGITDQISSYSKTFGYDVLDRITSDANNAGAWTYQYNANSKRTQRTITQGGTTTTQTPTYATISNQLTQLDGVSATVDAADNLIAFGIKGYAYNNANRLITYSESGVIKAMYGYNAFGNRLIKQGALATHYHYSLDGKIIAAISYNSDGTPKQESEYIWLNDIPIAQIVTNFVGGAASTTRTTYIHADHLNTPRAMTDSTKNIVWRWDGDAFGKTAPNENPDGDAVTDTLNLRFPGQIYDIESGTSDNGWRTYDANLGGYPTQADPIGFAGGSWSLHDYANSDPIGKTDPLGLAVNICCRPAQIAGGLINHCWIKTDTKAAGMGSNPNIPPGQEYEGYGMPVQITNHSNDKPTECTKMNNVNEQCVNDELQLGKPLGRFLPPVNQCQSFSYGVVNKCRTGPQQ